MHSARSSFVVHAGLVAALTGCGAHDAADESVNGRPGSEGPAVANRLGGDAGAEGAAIRDAGDEAGAAVRAYDVPQPARLYTLCPTASLGLDLSRLVPDANEVGQAFVDAWSDAASESDVPGFVVKLHGLDRGPVSAWVGAVAAQEGAFEFFEPSVDAQELPVDVDARDLSHVTLGPVETSFAIAFGPASPSRTPLSVSAFRLDGSLTPGCTGFVGRVELRIPGAEGERLLGTTRLGELLGGWADTDGDGRPDGWTIVLTGTAPAATVRP